MGGHVVFVVDNPQGYEPLIGDLASEGICAMCFRFIEEAVSHLREPGCLASVAVFHVAMRRQSDYTAIVELGIARPRLQILLAAQAESWMLDTLLQLERPPKVLDKPLDHDDTVILLRQALDKANEAGPQPGGGSEDDAATGFLHYSEEFLRRVGMADVPVLLSGETGVGKEVMARRLRAYSSRADKPFLKLNCAALPPELAESELFGSTKGAFTGATADRQGKFETAQGGTILLDEIGDMDLRLQTKLLQVLQDGEIQPLGSNRSIHVNVRVMAATHRDLTKAIQEGTFREDLYYRLNVIKIVIPPLRERRGEILPLAHTLLTRHLPKGQREPRFTDELKQFLVEYRWPGNVRELENVMRRFLVYQDSALLIQELKNGETDTLWASSMGRGEGAASLREASPGGRGLNGIEDPSGLPAESLDRLSEATRQAESELLLGALEANRWNRRQAAASLQIDYKAFLYKLQKHGISKARRKDSDEVNGSPV